MQAIRQEVTIQKENTLEIHSSLLKQGVQVEVIVLFKDKVSETQSSLRSRFGTGKGSFASPEEADAFIRSERDKWE